MTDNTPAYMKIGIRPRKPLPASNSADYCAFCHGVGIDMIQDENGRLVHGHCKDKKLGRK